MTSTTTAASAASANKKEEEGGEGDKDQAVKVLKEFNINNSGNNKSNNSQINPQFIDNLTHDLDELKKVLYAKALLYSSITTDLKQMGDIVASLTQAINKETTQQQQQQ